MLTYRQRVSRIKKLLAGTAPRDVVVSELPSWVTPYDLDSENGAPTVVIDVEGAKDELKWPDQAEVYWENNTWHISGRGF